MAQRLLQIRVNPRIRDVFATVDRDPPVNCKRCRAATSCVICAATSLRCSVVGSPLRKSTGGRSHLGARDVFSAGAFRSLASRKRHGFAFAQCVEGHAVACRLVEEVLVAIRGRHKAEALVADESFNRTGYWSHIVNSCVVKTRVYAAPEGRLRLALMSGWSGNRRTPDVRQGPGKRDPNYTTSATRAHYYAARPATRPGA